MPSSSLPDRFFASARVQPAYREQHPAIAALDAVWVLDASAIKDKEQHRVHPDGCVDLIFKSRRDRLGRVLDAQLLLVGSAERADLVTIAPGDAYVGLRFRPGWGGCVGTSPAAITGLTIDACETSSALKRAFDTLTRTRSTGEVASVLTSMCENWVDHFHLRSRTRTAAALLEQSGGKIGVSALARATGVSVRTLRRELHEATGISPKLLARVLRFRYALRTREGAPHLNLAALAQHCGYADQSHLTREFRALGGITPGGS